MRPQVQILNPSYLTPQDRVTFVIKLAALAARGGAEPLNRELL